MPALERAIHHSHERSISSTSATGSGGGGGSGSGSTTVSASSGNTTLALHYAAARGCLDCVRLLVDSSTELRYSIANTQMDNDVTPVYLAAQEGHLDVLKFLVLEAGGSLYVRAKDGMAPIHAASQMGCLNCVKWMIQDQAVDPNLRDGDGATPLHFAASRGHLDTVRWLLKHGARLSLDKYGKSPINDAAENQQVECLNVLVQHGTTPDYKETAGVAGTTCSCRKDSKRNSNFDSTMCNCKRHQMQVQSEPFYLHPPLTRQQPHPQGVVAGVGGIASTVESPHAPQDGLYINPMSSPAGVGLGLHNRRTSAGSDSDSASSSGGESFYLHNPQEVIYNRVKDLFPGTTNTTSALTVKVEVHSSSSGAGSDDHSSSSSSSSSTTTTSSTSGSSDDISGSGHDVNAHNEHDYEDIYMIHQNNNNNNDPIVSVISPQPPPPPPTPKKKKISRSRSRDSGSHSRSGSASSSSASCNLIVKLTATTENKHKQLMKAVSMPTVPAPPPPPPPPPLSMSRHLSHGVMEDVKVESIGVGTEEVEVVEEPTVRPSDVVKGMCRSMTALSAKRLNSSCSDLTIVSLEENEEVVHIGKSSSLMAGKTRVLPFVPPSFANTTGSNHLIKPSEYLKSIGKHDGSDLQLGPTICLATAPPPPPLPDIMASPNMAGTLPMASMVKESKETKKQQQPLSAISIHDINSVQLRRTGPLPMRSLSLQSLQTVAAGGGGDFVTQKTDLIAELKISKDITGIKKMKIERAKCEEKHDREVFTEISKQFSANNFVEKIPDRDNTGNVIPAWKRQMLAKKAAERARKELEEQMQREAEEKRLSAIPQWKRQLMAKKEENETKIRQYLCMPKVDGPTTAGDDNAQPEMEHYEEATLCNDIANDTVEDEESNSEEEDINIIPWRAQLRKTNSKLNLLD